VSSPAWMVAASSFSSPSGPSRFRHRVSELGLPVRVLDPALHHRLIGQVEGMLKIGQPTIRRAVLAGRPSGR
jgi:hypothetical protein